jgi:hypothetical protein
VKDNSIQSGVPTRSLAIRQIFWEAVIVAAIGAAFAFTANMIWFHYFRHWGVWRLHAELFSVHAGVAQFGASRLLVMISPLGLADCCPLPEQTPKHFRPRNFLRPR